MYRQAVLLLWIADTKRAADADLSVLKLDHDTVELLKNGHFNHRLLCEIIKHPDEKEFTQRELNQRPAEIPRRGNGNRPHYFNC